MNVLCSGNYSKSKFVPIVESLLSFFDEFPKHALYLDSYIKLEKLKNLNKLDKIYNPKNPIDFIICIGGDGAILSAIRRMHDSQMPVLGIHIGKLGFLNKMNSNNYIRLLKSILNLN